MTAKSNFKVVARARFELASAGDFEYLQSPLLKGFVLA